MDKHNKYLSVAAIEHAAVSIDLKSRGYSLSWAFMLLLYWTKGATAQEQGGAGVNDAATASLSDIAPLMQLFGERPTKSFIAVGRCWQDSVIAGVAPIGVLTMAVSALRLTGTSFSKHLIGRSSEGDETVADDLLHVASDSHVVSLSNVSTGDVKRVRDTELDVIMAYGTSAMTVSLEDFNRSKFADSSSTSKKQFDSTQVDYIAFGLATAAPENMLGVYKPWIRPGIAMTIACCLAALQISGLFLLDELGAWAATTCAVWLTSSLVAVAINAATHANAVLKLTGSQNTYYWSSSSQTVWSLKGFPNVNLYEDRRVNTANWLVDLVVCMQLVAYISQYLWLRTLSWKGSLLVLGVALGCSLVRALRCRYQLNGGKACIVCPQVPSSRAAEFVAACIEMSKGNLKASEVPLEMRPITYEGTQDKTNDCYDEMLSLVTVNGEPVDEGFLTMCLIKRLQCDGKFGRIKLQRFTLTLVDSGTVEMSWPGEPGSIHAVQLYSCLTPELIKFCSNCLPESLVSTIFGDGDGSVAMANTEVPILYSE